MATKKASKKTPAQPTVNVEEQLAEALAEKPDKTTAKHAAHRVPTVGERVSIGSSPNVFSITRVGDKDVDLQLPGTVVERFRVPVDDLRYIDEPKAVSQSSKPANPAINLEEVRERIATAQQSSIDQFSGDIAILKKYLKSKGVPAEAAEELDRLCEDTEKRWRTAVTKIAELLEE
ncbi:MAG TPA: hypothetical protein VK578_18940 [Edaphobacter sp.]|nr:hypothetical protein [Edaphobacter sp.]